MGILLAGLLFFIGMHSVSIVADPWRRRVAARWGETTWLAVFSIVSVVGLVLIIWGYDLARQHPIPVYQPPVWLRHVALLLLVFVFPLLLAAYLPGRIRSTVGHPMLVAVKLWAFAHLLSNGMLHDLVLFGAFLAWAVADRISLKRRVPPPVPGAPPGPANDLIAVVVGLALYAWFLLDGHARLIGVAPLG